LAGQFLGSCEKSGNPEFSESIRVLADRTMMCKLRELQEAHVDDLELKMEFDVSPTTLYEAWLDSETHGEMTESSAEIDPRIGGRHSSGDGYISGENLELEPGVRIVQSWRTTDFDDSDPDSRLELTFEETDEGSLLTLRHTNIPSGQGESYQKGWEEYYFDPMEEYFDGME